ncbi:MAG TPA: phenylalanine--tRNA ligase subunit beta [Cytophagaceae bacterium]|nr:phenylalanine--tRNA ligase subunit beta [Cytophagaceae bacterium]
MKISYNWLKQHIDLTESPEAISAKLTKAGLEVESVEEYESIKGGLKGLVIGQVLTCEKHPGADKLSKTTVDVGNGTILPIVCGAPNVATGQKVVVALVGTTMYPATGEPFKISKAKIRGEVSEGMICAEDEIGLGASHEGIMVLNTSLALGTPAAEYFKIENDFTIEIGLTPNRADAASHLGVARDLKALLKRELKGEKLKVESLKIEKAGAKIEVVVENKEACPRYAGLTISGITVKESPDWLKNRLKAIGLNPINNVVDVTNYILHDLGQPLHAFDLAKVKGNKVIVKTLPKDTEFITLDGIKRKLSEKDLMICNAEAPMCIAGVFGGLESGVNATTKAIFLESAYFSPDFVRKTSQFHGLKTDASFRFERGTDPNMPVDALLKAAKLIVEIAGGTVSSKVTDIYPEKVKDFKVETSYSYINRLIGKTLEKSLVKDIITGLNITIETEKEDELKLSVPPYKVDVQRPADIVEEVLRIYGYDNIELSDRLSAAYLADFPEKDKDKIQKLIGSMLAGSGFNEILTNSMTKPLYADYLGIADKSVEVLNKLSEDLGVMRQSLLFSGLEILNYNINRRQKDLKLFEFGKIYSKEEGKYKEGNCLALFITGSIQSESWNTQTKETDYFYLNSIVHKVLQKLNSGDAQQQKSELTYFSYGVNYIKNNKIIASLGKVQEKALKLADIKQPVYYAEFDADALLKAYKNNIQFQELNKYPEVRRDLSLVLDKNVTFEQIRQFALKQEKKLITDINVFDVYEGKNLGENKKSYSVSFTLQDFEQTLTDKVIDNTMQKLIAGFEKELGAVIRK